MPTAAIVNVSLRARHEQFAADMDKMSASGRRWRQNMERDAAGVKQRMEQMAGSAGNAARSFGQVATGALLMSTNLAEAGRAGQAVQQTFGAFLAGGPIAGGVTLLSNAISMLGESSRKAHEAAAAAAKAHEAALAKIADTATRAREASAGNLSQLEASRTGEDPAAVSSRKQYEADSKATLEDISKAQSKIRELEASLDRVRSREIATTSVLGIESGAARRKRKEIEDLQTDLKRQEELVLAHNAKMVEIDKAYNTGVVARGQKLLDEQMGALEKATAEAERKFAEAKARAADVAAEGSAKFDRQEESERGLAIAKAEEAALRRRIELNEEIEASLRKQRAEIEKTEGPKARILELEKALAEASRRQSDLDRAQAAADRASSREVGRPDAPGGGAAPGGGSSGDGGGGSGGPPWGGGFSGSGMGPLAAAREAKRVARQQRQWQRHADNLAAEGRERMGVTIDDFGSGGFGADDRGMGGGQRKPKQETTYSKQEGSDEMAEALRALNEAALARNVADAKAADAARSAAEATKTGAEKAGEVASSTEEVAASSGESATSLTAIASSMAGVVTSAQSAAQSLVSIVERVKALETSFGTIQAAVGGA